MLVPRAGKHLLFSRFPLCFRVSGFFGSHELKINGLIDRLMWAGLVV